jgi:hypothetical protein
VTEGEEPKLVDGVIWVPKSDRERVFECRDRFAEGNAVLPLVRGGLLAVPLDDRLPSLYAPASSLANTAL